MTVKIISKPVKICSEIIFTRCFIAKIFFDFIGICTEQILLFLIIPKSSRPIALTIANAPRTLCADSCVALTSFAFPIGGVDEGSGALVGRSAVYLPVCLPDCDFRAAI